MEVKENKGVGGWLLLLCIWLTFLIPAKSIYYIVRDYVRFWPYFGSFPASGRTQYHLHRYSLCLNWPQRLRWRGLVAYSYWAVYAAKIFLLIYAGSSLLDVAFLMLFPRFTGLPFQRLCPFMPDFLKEECQTILFVAVCYGYLHWSKRVRATYGMHVPTKESDTV